MKLFVIASLGLLALAEERTILSWTRSVEGCGQDVDIPQATSRIIYAVGPDNDKIEGDTPSLKYHSKRGQESVSLRQEVPKKDDDDKDESFEFRIGSINIPSRAVNDPETSNRTSYICGVASVPDWVMDGKKRHLTKVSPVINPANFGKVHHILMYICSDSVDKMFENGKHSKDMLKVPHACLTTKTDPQITFPLMPISFQAVCSTLIVGWAVGGGDINFPPEAGYPLGKDEFKYVYYEFHYDNFDQQPFEDNSGLRFHTSTELREFDAGVLQVGAIAGINVPPKEEAFDLKLRCPGSKVADGSGCLDNSVLGDEGVTITHTMMHAHLAARKVISNLVDESGNIITRLGDEKYYDFNLQSFYKLAEPVKLKAGHNIDVTCTYNTMDRDGPTVGGLGSLQEMCLGYYIYYPKKKLASCTQFLADMADDGVEELRYFEECGWRFGLEGECGEASNRCFKEDEECNKLWTKGEIIKNVSDCVMGKCHDNENFEKTVQCFFGIVWPCVQEKNKRKRPEMNTSFCGGPGSRKFALFPEFDVVEEEEECVPVESKNLDVVPVDSASDLTEYFKGYLNTLNLMEEPRYDLYWTYHPDRQEIDFAVDVATTGWVGFGISPNGGMVGSDIMLGWVTDGGDVHITDRYAEGKYMPVFDSVQSYSNLRGFRFSGDDNDGDDNPNALDYSKDCKSIKDLIECMARVNCDAQTRTVKKIATLKTCNRIPCKKLKSEKACIEAKDSGCKPKYKGKKKYSRCK